MPNVATKLAALRLEQLEAARGGRALSGRSEVATLASYARAYLIAKKRTGKVTDGWLEACEGFLRRAVEHFGADRPLESIRVSDVRSWASHIQTLRGRSGRSLGAETARRHLFTLSNLY